MAAELVLQKMLSEEEVAQILGVKPNTLKDWRCRGSKSLKYVKSGKLVRYKERDLAQFIEKQTVDPTRTSQTPRKRTSLKRGRSAAKPAA
jgi:hypothetical protein